MDIKKIIKKGIKILRSRTFWVVAVDIVWNIISIFGGMIPQDLAMAGNVFLGIMATYFHINPSQNYLDKK